MHASDGPPPVGSKHGKVSLAGLQRPKIEIDEVG